MRRDTRRAGVSGSLSNKHAGPRRNSIQTTFYIWRLRCPCRNGLYSCRWERISNPNPKFRERAPMEKDYLTLKRASASRPSGEWSDDDFDVLSCDFYEGSSTGAYLPRSFRASSHSFLGSRSPFFASSIINFATVSWGLGDRLAQACSVRRRMLPPNSEYLPAQTWTDSRSRGVLELARPTPKCGVNHIILRGRYKGRQQLRTVQF